MSPQKFTESDLFWAYWSGEGISQTKPVEPCLRKLLASKGIFGQDADDLVQETLCWCWEHFGEYHPCLASFRTWATNKARSLTANWLKWKGQRNCSFDPILLSKDGDLSREERLVLSALRDHSRELAQNPALLVVIQEDREEQRALLAEMVEELRANGTEEELEVLAHLVALAEAGKRLSVRAVAKRTGHSRQYVSKALKKLKAHCAVFRERR